MLQCCVLKYHRSVSVVLFLQCLCIMCSYGYSFTRFDVLLHYFLCYTIGSVTVVAELKLLVLQVAHAELLVCTALDWIIRSGTCSGTEE